MPHHLKVVGLNPAYAVSFKKEKISKKSFITLASSDSTVEEHLPHDPGVEGLNPAYAIGFKNEKISKKCYNIGQQ